MSSKDFKLPDLGEGVHEGQVLRVLVKPGDVVREDQPLMEVETDKAAVVIPCPYSGVVEKVHVKDGQLVHVGDVMVTIGSGSGTGSGSVSGTGVPTSVGTTTRIHPTPEGRATSVARTSPSTSATAIASLAKPQAVRRKPASPAVRKFAREMKIDIEKIAGSGPGGRVQRSDVEAAARISPALERGGQGVGEARDAQKWRRTAEHPTHPPAPSLKGRGGLAPAALQQVTAAQQQVAARVAYPAVPESLVVEPPGEDAADQYGHIKIAPLSQARKTIASVMSQSWTTIPHATDFDDADVTELEKIRKGYTPPDQADRKITLLAFVIRAVVRALQRFPEFNASIDVERNQVIYKRYINIAVGVHTERGLVPMVLRDADRMSIPQISDELNIISEKARTATFAVNDTRGGTYTISNAGAMGGSRYSTPIITPPQVAVLAIGRTRWMPWVIEQENAPGTRGLAPRLIMPLSHSIDHRLLDGGNEVQFMQHVIADLQNPARLLL